MNRGLRQLTQGLVTRFLLGEAQQLCGAATAACASTAAGVCSAAQARQSRPPAEVEACLSRPRGFSSNSNSSSGTTGAFATSTCALTAPPAAQRASVLAATAAAMPSVLHEAPAAAAASPASSDSQQFDRDAAQQTTKSARRKAAEALLAARYNSSSSTQGGSSSDRWGGSVATAPFAAASSPAPPRLKSAVVLPGAPKGVASDRQPHPAAALARRLLSSSAPPPSSVALAVERIGPDGGSAAPAASKATAVGGQGRPVAVAACDSSCSHPHAHGWCHMPVHIPHADWVGFMSAEPSRYTSTQVAPGYDRLLLPHGMQVLVVENPLYVPDAIKRLRASMLDPIIAIDLEWRPSFAAGINTPVAMVQLASARTAVLIRTCRMQYRLAPALLELLQDPAVRLVGFSWDSADEAKMQSTFGVGAASFPGFLDLQAVARGLGWHGYGLSRLTNAVLGAPLPKSKKVTMSNWETRVLTRQQIKYAALDVLISGQVFRGLRLWHRSPAPCAGCRQLLGAVQPPPVLVCTHADCGKDYGSNVTAFLAHCRNANHDAAFRECAACGCLRPAEALEGAPGAERAPVAGVVRPREEGDEGSEEQQQQQGEAQPRRKRQKTGE